MKCRYCKNEDIKIEIDYKNSKSKSKKINKNRKNCNGCGKNLALAEYRYPDVHFECRIVRTIKHYKCTNCGYMEISIRYDYIPSSAD
jgi:C4-type Zn-finger protein